MKELFWGFPVTAVSYVNYFLKSLPGVRSRDSLILDEAYCQCGFPGSVGDLRPRSKMHTDDSMFTTSDIEMNRKTSQE